MASSDEEEGEESEVDMEKMQKYRDLHGLDNSGSEDSDEDIFAIGDEGTPFQPMTSDQGFLREGATVR